MSSETTTALPLAKADHEFRTGTWLRLPCCDSAVHPVQILGQTDGIMEISAPREPHPTWVRAPHDMTEVTLGWSDAGGTLALSCQVVSDDANSWTLRVVGTGDFLQRRRHLRVPSDGVANLMDGELGKVVTAHLYDISESGMKCSFIDYIPNPSTPVTRWALRIDGTVLVVVAKLVWSGRVGPVEYNAGYEFLEVHDALLSRLRAHIMTQLAKHGPLADEA
jgi:hypothetical protein